MIRILAWLCACLALSTSGAAAQDEARFTILHFGTVAEIDPLRPQADLARVASVIARERSERRTVFVTHAGDALSPSVASAHDSGEHMTRLLNRMLVDVMVASNHEFDFGLDVALERFRQLDFPVLSANAVDGAARPAPLRGSTIFTVGRFKIAFIGATTADTAFTSNPGRLRFAPVASAVRAEADRLRAAGADFVVLLSAANAAETAEAAEAARADLVLAQNGTGPASTRFDGLRGHASIGLEGNLIVAVDIEIRRRQRDVGADVKVDARPNQGGEIVVEPQRTEQVVDWGPTFRIIDTRAREPDQLIEIAVQVELDAATMGLQESLATVLPAVSSARARVRTAEAGVGDIVADAMRAHAGADVALINAGAIRGDRDYEPESVWRLVTVAEEMPFANRLVTLRVSGAQLRVALEHALAEAPRESVRFLQVSGIALRYDPARPSGRRIVDLRVGGRPVQAARLYSVATSDFLARGGDGFAMFARVPRVPASGEPPLLRDVVAAYLRQMATLRTIAADRIVPVARR